MNHKSKGNEYFGSDQEVTTLKILLFRLNSIEHDWNENNIIYRESKRNINDYW